MTDRADDMMASYKTGQLWERAAIVKWLKTEQAWKLAVPESKNIAQALILLADAIERAEHER